MARGHAAGRHAGALQQPVAAPELHHAAGPGLRHQALHQELVHAEQQAEPEQDPQVPWARPQGERMRLRAGVPLDQPIKHHESHLRSDSGRRSSRHFFRKRSAL